MNVLKKSLIGLSLLALLASCSAGTTNKTAASEKSAAPTATEVQSDNKTTAATETTAPELLSTVDIKLLDGKVELSQPKVDAGNLSFNIRNEAARPLNVSVVKTTLAPNELKVKSNGELDSKQMGVEVLTKLHKNPIAPAKEETMTKILEPGEYQVVVTEAGNAKPIAYAMLTLQAL